MEQQKDKAGWIDGKAPQGYKQRFVIALLPCGLLMFIYWFFGPLDLIYGNWTDLGIRMRDALPTFLCAFLLFTLAPAALAALFRGKGFKAAVSLVFALAIVSYVQGSFLNGSMQLLNGADFDVAANQSRFLGNSLLCAVIFLAAFLLAWPLKEKGLPVVCGVCAALILMQSAALTSDFINDAREDKKNIAFSTADTDELSANQNVVVFLLDAFSNRAMQETLEKYPDTLADFHDFTYYTNCGPDYYGTFPAMIHILTGEDYDPAGTWQEFIQKAWDSPRATDFFQTLKEQNYDVQLYAAQPSYYALSAAQLAGKVDNAVPTHKKAAPLPLLKSMERLVLCRYLPLGLKQYVWCTPEDFADISHVVDEQGEAVETWNQYGGFVFLRDYLQVAGLRATQEKNCFKLYHFQGAHPGYFLTADGKWNNDGVERAEQCRGYLHIVETYMQQMRELGVYDDATIIILADHGYNDTDWAKDAMSTIVLVKEAGESHESVLRSAKRVSQSQFIPTVVNAVDPARTAAFGDTYASLPEDAFAQGRRIWMLDEDKNHAPCLKGYDYGDTWELSTEPDSYDHLERMNGSFYAGVH
ncbi:MAG: hypothetical protein Q4E65_04025 [Clostridia bacterium]|nr:hypothetical protein [Clostridia bacterium]